MLVRVFDRLTEHARQVVVRAQEEARSLKHDYVGTEHLLLGLLHEEEGRAARVLTSLGVTYESARQQVVQIVGAGAKDSPDQMPFTTPAKKSLELALHEALGLGHDYIGTEHLLLGLVSQSESVASGILRACNADPETVRDAVLLSVAGSDLGPPEPQVPANDHAADDGIRATSEVVATETYASGHTSGGRIERLAGSELLSDSPNRVTSREVPSTTYGSAFALAQAFGATILEPSWWPADTKKISYSLLNGFSDRAHYSIGSIRAEGVPLRVIGFLEAAWAGRSPRDWLHGEWSVPLELAHVRGLIGRVGTPPRLQVVIYDQQLAIQLVGYHTEDEIMSAVRSLRRIDPD
jgi:Clp amino terminal domain, pathogenicity island component